MNGTANSLHVKGATPERVQHAVSELLASEGFQVSSAEESDVANADQRITRGLWIAKSKGDWVSLFCSDFLFQQEIGRELSKRLGTHTINVWINEESSWHYTLFHKGEEIDQFDSTGDLAGVDDPYAAGELDEDAVEENEDDELVDTADDEDADEDARLKQGLDKITQLHEKLSHKMPDDVRAIVDRLNEGKATLGEMRRFDEWSQEHQADLLQFQNSLQEQTAELSASIQGLFQHEFQGEEGQAQEMLKEVLPPDMANAFGKILSGDASYEDLARLAEMSGMDQLQEDDPLLQTSDDEDDAWEEEEGEESFLSGELDEEDEDEEYGDEEQSAFSEEQLQIHLGALRPLLSKDADPDEVAETLTQQDEMAELPLGEFLDLLGIDDSYSDLDFDAIDELGEGEMEDRGIELSPLLLVRTK